MPEQFLHGVEVIEVDSGIRSIRTVKSSIIGLAGTATDLDALTRPAAFASDADWAAAKAKYPLNTPVLVAPRDRITLGAGGTLPAAVDGILDQIGAVMVIVRVAEGADAAATQANVIGGIEAGTGNYKGLKALLGAESVVGYAPRVLIAPGFSQVQAVATEMISVADQLRAVAIIDGPNTTDDAAGLYRDNFASARAYVVDPWTKVFDGAEVIEPASARVAGLIARIDNQKGFWWSPSNQEIYGITGTARPVDFRMGDVNSRANLLNERQVATIIRYEGFRLWGNRSCSSDPRWEFLGVRRTADVINDSLLRAHLWAVDRGITRTYLADVAESVNAYLRSLKSQGAIIDGRCWPDPDLNSPTNIMDGKVYFNIDFIPPYPAEHVNFRSYLNPNYLDQLLGEESTTSVAA